MNKEIKRLPDSELEVMLTIWKSGEILHTGEIHQRIGKGRPIQAVQTLLGRLCDKGFLRCEKRGRLNFYHPLAAEEDYRRQETASFLEKLYGNSAARLVAALVQSDSLSESDLAEIRGILEKGGAD